MDVREILEKVKDGTLSVSAAEAELKNSGISDGFVDMGYARLDSDRKNRTGFAEVVYCAGKTPEQLCGIYSRLYQSDKKAFGTRASQAQADAVKQIIPCAQYDPLSRILWCDETPAEKKIGKIVVCTAGTSDIPVAEEAARTAEYFGSFVQRLYDVGVSGIHRLLSNMDVFRGANAVIAAAGMEGALASVIGGLVSVPVIAVPTSVGYGASFNGLSALLTMINSCSNGISVVNIDNGFGAAYIATQINRLAVKSA